MVKYINNFNIHKIVEPDLLHYQCNGHMCSIITIQTHTQFKGDGLYNNGNHQMGLNEFTMSLTLPLHKARSDSLVIFSTTCELSHPPCGWP